MGIDIGTTSVKTAVFNEALEQKISLTADYTLDAHGDVVEFDGEKFIPLKYSCDEHFAENNMRTVVI